MLHDFAVLRYSSYPIIRLPFFITSTARRPKSSCQHSSFFLIQLSYKMSAPNYSLYALPAFYVLALAPQAYSTSLINRATNNRFDNANPRSPVTLQTYQKSTDAATYAKFERARSAHSNSMENMPLFFAAVILANMAKVNPELLNTLCAAFLAVRVLYIVLYIQVESKKLAYSRSVAWAGGAGICLYLMVKAGNVLVGGNSWG